MQTAYDLLLQPPVGAPFEPDPVQTRLKSLGATTRGDGALLWRFAAGEVVVLPFREALQVRGLELKVPFSERTDLLGEALSAVLELAKAEGLRVIDPQLGRTVLEGDLGAMADEFLRISRYAGQYHGLGDALPMLIGPSQDEGLSPATKGLLALLVFGVAMAAAWQYFAPD